MQILPCSFSFFCIFFLSRRFVSGFLLRVPAVSVLFSISFHCFCSIPAFRSCKSLSLEWNSTIDFSLNFLLQTLTFLWSTHRLHAFLSLSTLLHSFCISLSCHFTHKWDSFSHSFLWVLLSFISRCFSVFSFILSFFSFPDTQQGLISLPFHHLDYIWNSDATLSLFSTCFLSR